MKQRPSYKTLYNNEKIKKELYQKLFNSLINDLEKFDLIVEDKIQNDICYGKSRYIFIVDKDWKEKTQISITGEYLD